MAYCTIDDIKAEMLDDQLVRLTNDDPAATEIVSAVVTAAITEASDIADAYIRTRYVVPLSPVPAVVKGAVVDLVVYRLMRRAYSVDQQQGLTERYDNAIGMLKDISAGRITLDASTGSEGERVGANRIVTNKTADDRMFSKELLDKMP